MAPLGSAACSEGLKKGNNYILDHLKRDWMLTVYISNYSKKSIQVEQLLVVLNGGGHCKHFPPLILSYQLKLSLHT